MARCLPVLLIVLVVGSDLPAQQEAAVKKEDRTLVSRRDGWPIFVTYYQSRLKKNAAVVVLLHGDRGNRRVWTRSGGMAESLQSLGYAVIAVDLRKHGQSVPPGVNVGSAGGKKGGKKGGSTLRRVDYNLMVISDMEAVKKFIYDEHQAQRLNMRKLAVVAAEMSAPVAVAFAANDWNKKPHADSPTFATRTPRGQDVRALVLLSPKSSVSGLQANKPMRYLKTRVPQIAFLVCVGSSKSKVPLADANKLYKVLKPIAEDPKKRTRWFNEFPVQLQGTDLLGKKLGVESTVQGFLGRYLNELKDPWRNRRSKAAT